MYQMNRQLQKLGLLEEDDCFVHFLLSLYSKSQDIGEHDLYFCSQINVSETFRFRRWRSARTFERVMFFTSLKLQRIAR